MPEPDEDFEDYVDEQMVEPQPEPTFISPLPFWARLSPRKRRFLEACLMAMAACLTAVIIVVSIVTIVLFAKLL